MNLRVWLRNWLLKPSNAEAAANDALAATAGKLISGHLIRAHALNSQRESEIVYSFVDEIPEREGGDAAADASLKSMIRVAMDHKELIREELVGSDQGQPIGATYREDAGHIPPPSAAQARREEGTP